MRRGSDPTSGPLPSIGSPRALTTLPSTPSPTGTERILPVDLTFWPSSMFSTLPNTTAPIESSSRLRARPTSPLSNSRISFTEAFGSPDTLAIPSPTSRMRPTVPDSTDGSKPSRFFWIAAVISAASKLRSVMTSALSFFRDGYVLIRQRLCRLLEQQLLRGSQDRQLRRCRYSFQLRLIAQISYGHADHR